MIMNEITDEPELDPPRKIHNREHYVCINAIGFPELNGMISTDQTGRFPITSGQGNTHIMVLYDHDSNFINATAIKSRNTIDLIAGYEKLYKELYNAGIRPLIQRLDNEASEDLIAAIKDKDLHFQLAPAGNHRTLPAERAIQTFKNHFIAGLYGVDDRFPGNQWDRLIPQTIRTLNMLRPSRINPKLSAYMQVWGAFDFNKTPLAPIGCKAVIHDRPENRGSWDSHGTLAYYIDIAENHYRNYKCYVPETHATRISDTVEFFPKLVQMPKTSSEDRLAAILEDLKEVLKHPHPKTPFLDKGTKTNDAITKLETIFGPPKKDNNNNRPRVIELPRV